MKTIYIDPTQEAGKALFLRDLKGEVVMLNLLRFKAVADYSDFPELAGSNIISGKVAFQKYIDHTLPFLTASGGSISFLGEGGKFLIGPQDERWDLVMLIKQKSLSAFLEFASNPDYMAGIGHRTAAIEDSRLLPIVENNKNHIITKNKCDA